jgi:hypothetical protein
MNSKIEEITMYRTPDGKVHHSLLSAEMHQEDVELGEKATSLLRSGISLYQSLLAIDRYNRLDSYDEEELNLLKNTYHTTGVIVSHLQCCEKPVYFPIEIRCSMSVRLYGNEGHWSSPYGYGDWFQLDDVIRYLKRTFEKEAM